MRTSSYLTRERLILFLLFLFALIVRVLIIFVSHFDGLYGQDAFAYLDYTKQILALHLTGPFYWPLGYPALAALFASIFRDPVIGAQAANVILGSAFAVLIYLLTDEVFTQLSCESSLSLKIIPALIAALAGQLVHSSIVIMSDVSALFWATLSAYSLIRLNRSSQWFWLPLAALTLAFAIVTRFVYAGLILPFGLYFLVEHRSLIRSSRFWISAFIFFVIVTPQIIFSQSSAQPILTHGWVVNWNPLHAFQTSFDNPDGHFDYRLPPLFFYAEPFFHPYYLFPLLTPFTLLGFWRWRRSPLLLLFGGWIFTLYFYLVGVPYENFRFGLACFPPIILLTALGLAMWSQSLQRALWLYVCFCILASLPFAYRGLRALFVLKADELDSARYLQRGLPPRSAVLTFGLTPTIDHYTDFQAVDLFDQSPQSLRSLICSSNNSAYLFVQVNNLETQWRGKTPYLNYRWLRDQIGLYQSKRYSTWTLFKIRQSCVG